MTSFINKFNCASSRDFSPPASQRSKRSFSLRRKKPNKQADQARLTVRPSAPPYGEDSDPSIENQHYPPLPPSKDTLSNRSYSSHHLSNSLPEKTLKEPVSFWDIGNYKYALKRCDNGKLNRTEESYFLKFNLK
jgi:hypothetical protein